MSTFASQLDFLLTLTKDQVVDFARRELHWHPPCPDQVLMGFACLAGNLAVVRTLLRRNPGLVHAPCIKAGMDRFEQGKFCWVDDDSTPLLAACQKKHWTVARFLLSHSPALVNARSGGLGCTAFHHVLVGAIQAGNPTRARPFLAFAKRLIDQGASPLVECRDGTTPFSQLVAMLLSRNWSPGKSRVFVRLWEMCFPVLGVGCPPLQGKARDSLEKLLSHLNPGSSIPGILSRELLEKSGISLSEPRQAFLAWLFAHGVREPVLVRFAKTHAPESLAFADQKDLDRVLPDPTLLSRSTSARRL
jgi:hypothetical protein